MLRDAPIALPCDLISTDFTHGSTAAAAPILRHSIGLGAGTTLGAAMMHGLLECIEADARLRAEATGGAQRLALSPDDPDYGPVLDRLQTAKLRAAIYSLPSKAGVFAIKASVMEHPGAAALPLPATGYAARPHQPAAIAAALAEALQARLAVISGAREDITQRLYVHGFSRADLGAEWARHGPATSMIGAPTGTSPTLRDLAMQVGPVIAVPLHWDPELPLAIVRILVPDLVCDPLRLVSQ
jgi:ribosomal protein S12 methylthiotransferase accessory factor